MARGLVLGATLISVFSLILAIVYTYFPLWLVLRIESGQQFCWWGEGIFHSRVYYGQYLPLIFRECEDPQGYGPLPTTDAYCSENPVPPLNDQDPPDYAAKMCTATNRAKITSSTSVCTAAITVCLGVVLHFTKLRRKYEYGMVMVATALSLSTILLTLATLAIMWFSPLFSMDHVRALSKVHKGSIPYDGFSCSLTSPLRSPLTMLFSASLQCLFPGPSFLATFLLFISQSIATIFLFMLSRQIRTASKKFHSQLHETMLSASPLLGESEFPQVRSHLVHDEENLNDDQLFKELRTIRVYSLYGALARRTASWGRCQQWLVITFAPFALILLHVLCWTAFLLLGVQIIAGYGIKFAIPRAGEHISGELMEDVPTELYDVMRTIIMNRSDDLHSWLSAHQGSSSYISSVRSTSLVPTDDVMMQIKRDDFVILQDVVNCFNFSPELSIGYFWNNGAAFIAVLSFLAMFVLPIGKSLFWVWYWFAPGDEWWRGWVLTFVDFSGKWMLAYVFIMAILGSSLALNKSIVFPGELFLNLVPKHSLFIFELNVGMTWNGLGCWLLVVACVSSLLIGQIVLFIHQNAVEWEEKRREMKDSNPVSPTLSMSTPSTMTAPASASSTESPYLVMDTPALTAPSLRSVHHNGQRVLIDPATKRTTNVMQAIESFSNLQDLAGMATSTNHQQEHHDQEEARKPLLAAIARYGSRTLLNESESLVSNHPSQEVRQSYGRPSRSYNGPGLELSKAIHPEVEAMCDRIHQPMHGVRLRWTPFGKALIWFCFFLLSGMFIVSQMLDIFEVEQTGVMVIFTNRFTKLSIVTMAQNVLDSGYLNERPYQVAAMIFITLSTMPLIRLLLVAYLWVLPLTIKQQKRMFSFLEFSEAWSSLEVFLVTVVGIKLEMTQLMGGLTGAMTPNVTKIILFIFPFFDGLAVSKIQILPGFYFILSAVLLEKIVSRLIMQQAATAIAERQAEKILRNFAKASSGHGEHGNLERIDENLSWGGPNHAVQRDMTGVIGDATEGLLETNAAFFFSPAGRYMIAPHTLYAGLPRQLWTGFFVKWGFMADADVVRRFGSPSSFSPATATPGDELGGPHNVVNDGFVLEGSTHPLVGGSPEMGLAATDGEASEHSEDGGNSPLIF